MLRQPRRRGARLEPRRTRSGPPAALDLALALELARATDTPMRLAALCEEEMIEAIGRGWADRDASIFLTLQEEHANVQVRLPPP